MEIIGTDNDERIVGRNISPYTELIEIWGRGGHDHITAPSRNPAWISGGPGDDTVLGGTGSITVYGYYGNDLLDCRNAGYANLYGDIGDDYLIGGNGGNTLSGGTGNDTMKGGTGSDAYWVDSVGDVIIEPDTPSGLRDLVNSDIGYTLGAKLENLLLWGSGDINGRGNASANWMTGNFHNNRLEGLNGNDTINGSGGNDLLRGGQGRDVLTGGTGRDVFDFNAVGETTTSRWTCDTITDFATGTRGDRIDLSTIDANRATGANEAFRFIGGAAFSANATGQLRYVYDAGSGKGILYGSTDADTAAEFAIQLNGVPRLAATDFVL